MEPKSEPKDRSIENKSEALKEEGSPSGKPPPVKKEEKPHPTHSFIWKFQKENPTIVTCDIAGTVEDSLKRNKCFEIIAKKNEDKELVLLRNGKAICSHFPCSLIKDECLTVKFIVKPKGEKAGGSAHVRRRGSSDEVVLFHVRMTGGEGVKRILKNQELKNKTGVDEMTVFAYKGETVEEALKGDARFQDSVFNNKCMLSNDDFDVDMSNLVDDLDEKTFTIQRDKKVPTDPEAKDIQEPEPTSEEMRIHLSSQFENLLNGKKADPFQVGNKKLPMTEILRVEYGKNAQTCTEVKTMKKLMGFSDSVCQVRINGKPAGSGFLLFDRFVLTNAHVVKNVYNDSEKELNAEVIVHFSYESLNQTEREQESVAEVEVDEVAGFEYTEDVYDWALLKLKDGVKLPKGLLNECGDLNKSHGVRIIGHPDGGVKKIETCLSIAPEKQKQVVENNSVKLMDNTILITDRYFKTVTQQLQRRKNNRTYFNEGASGSPVFDKDCNVLAMHSGGYKFIDESVIEFGYSLFDILERIIIQLVEKEEADQTYKEFFKFFCKKEEPVPKDT